MSVTNNMPPAIIRTAPALVLLLAGNVLLLTGRASMVVAIAIVVVGAIGGTLRVGVRTFPALATTTLLAASVVVYPLFFGGNLLPWLTSMGATALIVLGWTAQGEAHRRVVIAQVLATALAGGLAIAAVLFFFPPAWQWSVAAALVGFGLLAWAIAVGGTGEIPTSIAIAAVVLAETVAVLRMFPSHWVVNGVVLALAFAAIVERERFPRTAYASLLVLLLAIGVF